MAWERIFTSEVEAYELYHGSGEQAVRTTDITPDDFRRAGDDIILLAERIKQERVSPLRRS